MITKVIEEDIDEIIKEFGEELKKLEGKTIFITGGNGFIPSYIVDVIIKFNKNLQNPCKLIIMNKNKVNENSRLSHLLNDKNVSFIAQDVGKPFEITGKPNIIIHAASRANPTAFMEDPLDTIDANVNGIRNLLEYARNNSVEQFIFFSSAEIYGNPVKEFIPTPESYTGNTDCTDGRACYTEAKRFGETLCMAYYRKFNVPVKMLRILLAYGPGMKNDGKVVSDFFNRASKEKGIGLRDKGDATRSFCYVSDCVRAIFKIIFSGKTGEAYNIGNDLEEENVTILELARRVAKLVGENIEVKPNMDALKKNVYGIETRRVDITKLRNLGFELKIPLNMGLERTRRYYDEIGSIS
ncbi:NAD-dependent epimerase/dehydratase family protein [Candidatus Pacearchaeota archaeon]|nr:NAD-dependent epimerase/dehydratase family protein [Candidatus Pacearchaeota archaeon]